MAPLGSAAFRDPAKAILPEVPKSLSAVTEQDGFEEPPRTSPSLPRAASYTHLPSATSSRSRANSGSQSGRTTGPERGSHAKKSSQDNGRIRISTFAPEKATEGPDTSYHGKSPTKSMRKMSRKPRIVSDGLVSLARKSWISPSRPQSPTGLKTVDEPVRLEGLPTSRSTSALSSLQSVQVLGEERIALSRPNHVLRTMSLRGSGLLKRNRKSQIFGRKQEENGTEADGLSTTSLSRSPSSDKMLAMAFTSAERPAPIPTSSSTDRLSNGSGREIFKKKDELWTVFRTLEHDYSKFHSKSSSLKANVVRSALIPFLATYHDHPSTRYLRPEDLDRRISILNRWWTGLLEILEGTKSTLSGTDRPVLLDGILGLMAREEWRLSPSSFSAHLAEQSSRLGLDRSSRTQSSSSIASTASDFITESIYHNIRNTFVQNLFSQTAIVVDKMSNKTAPASLVAFGGKALAYAFFFCPGFSDILLHLWATPLNSVRRISREFGLSEGPALGQLSKTVASEFPASLRPLGFQSFAATVRWLRKRPTLPPGAGRINWYGSWIGRWIGRDSDLFFCFVKQWHLLQESFLPADAGLMEKACSPAFVLVHAQILTILDSTIHRQVGQSSDHGAANTSAATLEEVLGDANATATNLPLPATNVVRSMAENRLIMLLREILSKRSAVSEGTRYNFAEAFVHVLQAAARGTSVFDHSACFTLCDFLEESATILIRYQTATPEAHEMIDWRFWLQVCKRMSQSQNTMSELRLLAFLYSIWSILTADEARKDGLVLGWLIGEKMFTAYFHHWCPIIRAYYMRLLCWRVARCDGEASELDIQILETLSARLADAWSSFLQANAVAATRQLLGPSTAPCSPAPGRRLLIIRDDTLIDTSLLSTFEGLIQMTGNGRRSGKDRRLSLNPLGEPGSSYNRRVSVAPPSDLAPGIRVEHGRKKKWGLLRNIKSLSVSARPPEKPPIEEAMSPPRYDLSSDSSNQTRSRSGTITPDYKRELQHSFRFSLEWMERPHKAGKERRLLAPRLPNLATKILQAHRPPTEDEAANSSDEGEGEGEVDGLDPLPEASEIAAEMPTGSKYVGRALAEWALIVLECQNFFERRAVEGVRQTHNVETPVLGMDAFRRHGH